MLSVQSDVGRGRERTFFISTRCVGVCAYVCACVCTYVVVETRIFESLSLSLCVSLSLSLSVSLGLSLSFARSLFDVNVLGGEVQEVLGRANRVGPSFQLAIEQQRLVENHLRSACVSKVAYVYAKRDLFTRPKRPAYMYYVCHSLCRLRSARVSERLCVVLLPMPSRCTHVCTRPERESERAHKR